MKNLAFLALLVLGTVSKTYATLAFECGPLGSDRYQIDMSVEDDNSEFPKDWSFYVGTHSVPASKAKVQMTDNSIEVNVEKGGEVATHYSFLMPPKGEDCEDGVMNTRVQIDNRLGEPSITSMKCACVED